MEILRVIHQKLDVFSAVTRYFLIFLTFNILFLLSGIDSSTWAFKPPPQPKPLTDVLGTKVSLPDKLILESPPKSWGLPIRDSSGEIHYSKENYKPFLIKLNLRGLSPNHRYILSLNGKPWHESNEKLPQSYGKEGYYDFTEIITNNKGEVEKYLSLDLQSGKYNVKFFVKDPANEWKIVLYNDFLIFTIK